MKIPIRFPHIAEMKDEVLVPRIRRMAAVETSEFFYGKAAPIFIKLYNAYYTDCKEEVEFINDFYVDLMTVRPQVNNRKIDGFAYECMFKNWIGKLAQMYCYQKYDQKPPVDEKEGENGNGVEPGIWDRMHRLDSEDVEALLNSMANKDYRDLIRMVYLEEMSLQDAALALGVDMANFYNMHRRAKLQYVQVYNNEMRI